MSKHRLFLLVLILAAAAVASDVQAQVRWRGGDVGSMRFRIGAFQPRADSSYWNEKFDTWTGRAKDFEDTTWAIDGRWMFTPTTGVQIGSSWYQGDAYQVYRDWVDNAGNDIGHRTELTTADVSAAWIYRPLTGSFVRPYLGAGVGFIGWRLREFGDFIDFAQEGAPVVITGYEDEGTVVEAFGLAGLEFWTHSRWSVFVEGRWREAKDTLGRDFADLHQKLDLGGAELTAGFALNF